MEQRRVAYVIRMFPQLSETFVANEILSLERLGMPLEIFSYRRPSSPVPHECVRQIKAPITYLPDPLYRHPLALAAANSRILLRESARYSSTIRFLARDLFADHEPYTWRRFQHAVALAAILKGNGIDHLHGHFAHAATRVTMLASMMTGLRFSFSAHAKDIYTSNPQVLRKKIEAAEFVMTCTKANQDYLRSLVPEAYRARIKLGYHGVDVGKWTNHELTPSTDPPLILSVGRLVEKKGFEHLLRACDALRRDGGKFRCRIVGDGPQKQMLRTMIAELDLGDVVTLTDGCSQETLIDHYREATVFALPCQVMENGDRDGIPNVLLEAMAVGVPVITSGVSGIPEIIRDGHNGVLVQQRDCDALAAGLGRMLRDGELRGRLALSARDTVMQEFDSSVSGRKLAHLFGNGNGHVDDRAWSEETERYVAQAG